jgi:hypothetical protein
MVFAHSRALGGKLEKAVMKDLYYRADGVSVTLDVGRTRVFSVS